MTAATFDIKANDKTKAAFESVKTKFKKLGKDVVKYTSIAGAALTGLSVLSARNAKETIAYARAIGISTKELSAWGFASETVSVSQEKLNDILKDTSEKIGDAYANKGGEAVEILERLNLNTKEMAALSPDKQLLKIAEGLGQVGTQSEKVLILESLASDASLLIPLLDNNAEKLKQLTNEAHAMGVSLNDIDAAKIEAANNAWTKTLSIIEGVGQKIAAQFSPYIVEIADRFGDASKSSNGFADAVERGMKSAVISVAYLGDGVRGLEVSWLVVKAAFQGFAAGMFTTLEALAEGINKVAFLIPGINVQPIATLSAITKEANKDFNETSRVLSELVEKPMPSENIEAFFNNVEERATSAAEKVASITGGNLTGPETISGFDPITAFNEEAAAKFEALDQSLLLEDERLLLAHENRQFMVEDAFQTNLIDDVRRKEILETLELNHQAKLGNLEARGMIAREAFRKKSSLAKNRQVFGEIAQLTAGVAQSNRTLFEINKIAGISNAIVDTYRGVTRTMAEYPYPLNIGMAALSSAAGLAQVSAIKNSSFGGGGGAPSIAGGGGGGSSTVNTIPFAADTSNQETQQSAPDVVINIDPDALIVGQVLVDTLETLADNGVLNGKVKVG